MKTTQDLEPTQDERMLSALAHVLVILPFWGLLGSAIILLTQREKSAFLRGQAAQAVAWQVSAIIMMFVTMACYFVSFFLMFVPLMRTTGGEPAMGPPPGFFAPFAIMGCYLLLLVAFVVIGIWAAVVNLQGRPFRYPLIGGRVEGFLES